MGTSTKVSCKVKRIEFKTNHKGIVNIIVMLHQTKELKKLEVNSIVLKTLHPLTSQGLGLKSVLKCEFCKRDGKILNVVVIKKSSLLPQFPKFCTDCGTQLRLTDQAELFCNNYVCPSRPTAFMHRLIEAATGLTGAAVEPYIQKYVTVDGPVNIEHFDEFFFVITGVGAKDTKTRLKLWQKHHGKEQGEFLFDLDKAVSDYLGQDTFKIEDFWKICSFPRMTEESFKELLTLSPEYIDPDKLKLLSKKTQDYIVCNTPFIAFLYKKLTGDKIRKWV